MINRIFKKFDLLTAFKGFVSVFLVLELAACGGGAATATATNVPNMQLSLLDASGNSVASVIVGTTYTLKAIASQSGGAAANEVVTFSAGGLGSLSPASGTALTNSLGVATITFVPTAAGAAAATATATVNKVTTTAATPTVAATSVTTRVAVNNTLNYGVTAATISPSAVASLTLSLVDSADNPVNSMVIGTNYRLKAVATDTTGAASNVIVTFSPSGSATLIPTAGTALTNGNGLAQVSIVPSLAGAATATASFSSAAGTLLTKSVNFSIAPLPTTTLGALTAASSSVSSGGTTNLSINTLVNQALASGVSVLFNASCGQITTTNPAVSNSSGVATATYRAVTAGGTLCTGATTVQAAADGSTAFAALTVAPPVTTLANFVATPASIASATNSTVTLTVLSNGVAPTSAVNVALVATCGQVSPAVATTNGTGQISATYSSVKADGTLCQGLDTIAATASGATASANITVAAPTSGSISFVAASPTQIFLNSSGATSTSTLSFKSLYPTGAIAPATSVKLTLTGNPGGVTFGTLGNTSPLTVTSDAAGVATVQVFAGNVPGPVTVAAEWSTNSAVSTASSGFTIASGSPQQKSLSLSVDTNINAGADIDGESVTIKARVADQNGNPVPDGTVVNFVSSGGQINRSCSTTTANTGGLNATGFSQCSVTLISQAYRPTNGRVAVLAYLEGIKNYVDNNGNGAYDAGVDTLSDQGDAYRDDNENGQYDAGEFLIAKGGTGACTGAGKPTPRRVNTCTSLLPTTVRSQIMILWSSVGTAPTFTRVTSASFTTPEAKTFKFYLNSNATGLELLPLPGETSVAVKVLSPTSGCTASDSDGTMPKLISIGNSSTNVGALYPFSVTLTGTPAVGSTPAIVCKDAVLQITTVTTTSSGTVTWRISQSGAYDALTNPSSTVVP